MTTGGARPDDLLARWRDAGDPSALGALFDAVAPELFGISLHMITDPALAEDALQETFLAALRHLDRHDPARPVVPWLVGILRMKVREIRRRRRRTPDPDRLPAIRAPADPAQAAANAEEEERVRTALAELPEPYRRVALRDERLPSTAGKGTEEEIAFGAASRLSVVDAGGRTIFSRAGVQRRGLTPWSRIDLAPGVYAVVLETPDGSKRESVGIGAGATENVVLR